MKRRVIQLAGKTHVLSLPSKWVKSYNIKKGDELDIEELGNSLTIKSKKSETELKKISLNIDSFGIRTFRYAISALHKAGYDEIVLYGETSKLKDSIQDLIQNLLLGFVVIEQTSKKIVLKSVTHEIESEFDPTLRRAFLVTISLANSSLEMMSLKQFSSLQSLINLEKTNNQLTSFCLRLMNKGLYKDKDKEAFLVTIVWNLEKIADEYKAICMNFSDNTKEIDQSILKLYKEVNELFVSYYDLIYKFSPEKLNELVDKKNEIANTMSKINPSNDCELGLFTKLSTIVSKTSDLSSSIFGLHYKELVDN